ncbi:hypothetical protein A3D71_01200 [Candidatus Kaiserbacteria bacterium RIFCSPHIGHO2_02_FULL_55_20]|uniref:Uncharacterized protein n=1 Tax=Candidatus Kaiserbacteria bacterium RIFCSPHIGHO2_02_FULL_55_20 TaxID=1798497 RepID=A0A1F6DYQ1_9BACT|nr:MAG: hypothetical protein A2680_01840 [Candidatus Kaiserbacteria bacterium RIFCSPHIGHO2_01_FULL_55_37]OGG66467.1 MAG: hypothetical protein A3D71_01200 [Candidatus Kaiserbacteria bacterium RIFCSPHIGHO2_02_FULL_55_20]
MGAIISRMLWFFVVASAVAYAVYLVAGTMVHAQESRENQAVIIRDELGPGVHHLSGMIVVPSSCDQLSVRTEEITDYTYELIFRTWREPSVDCTNEEVPRYFRTILIAPATGVTFTASFDATGFPVIVVPIIASRT